jgi:hypothetical protein
MPRTGGKIASVVQAALLSMSNYAFERMVGTHGQAAYFTSAPSHPTNHRAAALSGHNLQAKAHNNPAHPF